MSAASRETPRASVVVAARNAARTIDAALEGIAGQRWDRPWEVVVSDNGSTDDTRARVEGYRDRIPDLRLVDSSDAWGPGHARNVGVAHARGELLLFADADDVVAPGWLAGLARTLETLDVAVGRMEFERLNPPWVRATRRGHQASGPMEWWLGEYLPYAYGGTLAVRRDWHDRIGGFDEAMLPASEDIDYCWRLQEAGASLGFTADAVVHYRLRDSISGLYRQARDYGESWALLYRKHRPNGLPEVDQRPLAIARRWARACKHAPLAFRRDRRACLAWEVGTRIGMVRGSIRHRVIFL